MRSHCDASRAAPVAPLRASRSPRPTPGSLVGVTLTVRPIPADDHLAFLREQSWASFLQTPAWATVKTEWRAESLGWFDGERLVGAGLVLYRQLPAAQALPRLPARGPGHRLGRPTTSAPGSTRWPRTCGGQGAFGVRMGPPVVTRRWSAAAGQGGRRRRRRTPARRPAPDGARRRPAPGSSRSSQALGWRPQVAEGGFAAGQPQYNFWIPLRAADGTPRTEDDVLAGMNQLWRRNIKKAAKAGVEVTHGDRATRPQGLPRPLRPHRRARPLHARGRWPTSRRCSTRCGAEEPDRIRLYLAHHEGDLVAATIWVRVGAHAWYSYGASSTEKRDVRGSNAVQWAMIRDALAAGRRRLRPARHHRHPRPRRPATSG